MTHWRLDRREVSLLAVKRLEFRPTEALISNGSALAFAALMGAVIWALQVGRF
jgi:hypothetical protein